MKHAQLKKGSNGNTVIQIESQSKEETSIEAPHQIAPHFYRLRMRQPYIERVSIDCIIRLDRNFY